jgi:hypothetical protein
MPHDPHVPSRGRKVSFRVTVEEYAALETQARQAQTSVSGHIRAAFAALWSERGRRQHQAAPTAAAASMTQAVALLGRIHATLQGMQTWATTQPNGGEAVVVCAHLVAVERALAEVGDVLEGQPH